MATVADGGAVSLSGPPLPASATPASTSQCHLLAADGLGENPFEVASSSTDSGLAPLLLQALLGAPWSASAVVTQHVLVANGIPTIPKNLLLRIRRGEYVDFADLLPAVNPADQSSALRFSLLPGYEVVRRRRHNISTISEWMQAFIVYAAAVVSADPSMALEMLAYALTVILASQHFDGLHWRAYDTHYCINVAASGNRSWSNLDTDLYIPFFTEGRIRSHCARIATARPTGTRIAYIDPAHQEDPARPPVMGKLLQPKDARGLLIRALNLMLEAPVLLAKDANTVIRVGNVGVTTQPDPAPHQRKCDSVPPRRFMFPSFPSLV